MEWEPPADQDLVTFYFEFGFLNGSIQDATAVLGRDVVSVTEKQIRIERHAVEDVSEELLIELSALAYRRTTKRVVTADTRRQEAWREQTGIGGVS